MDRCRQRRVKGFEQRGLREDVDVDVRSDWRSCGDDIRITP